MRALEKMSLEELWQLFPIVLKEHNPNYELWYEEERAQIARELDSRHIYRISHIGSTAVKGLIAKPIIDILLELVPGCNKDAAIRILREDGWLVMAENEEEGTVDLNKGYTLQGFAEKVFHLHIKPPGDWGELYFRDYLKMQPEIAREYERLKLELKEEFEYNRDAYTEAKTEFVRHHTCLAKEAFPNRYIPK